MLAASAASLGFAAAGWAVLYGFTFIAVFLFSAISRWQQPAMGDFTRMFVLCASGLHFVALVDRWIFRHTPDVEDDRPPIETLLDIALFLPRMLLAVFEHTTVFAWLSKRNLRCAAILIKLLCERGKLALHELPRHLPCRERDCRRILDVLGVTQIIVIRRAGGAVWIYLSALGPMEFQISTSKAGAEGSRAGQIAEC